MITLLHSLRSYTLSNTTKVRIVLLLFSDVDATSGELSCLRGYLEEAEGEGCSSYWNYSLLPLFL